MARSLCVAVTFMLATAVVPETTTITHGNGRHQTDDWNINDNWDKGVPSGSMNAVVAPGVRAVVDGLRDAAPTTPLFTGHLTLQDNAYLRLEQSANAVLGASEIILGEGSTIMSNFPGTIDYPPVTLKGHAHFQYTSTGSHGKTSNFKTIRGNHTLTITGSNRMKLNFDAASTFSSLIINASDRFDVYAESPSCLGSGDVTISGRDRDGRSAQLHLNVANTIGDHATLTLNGRGYDERTSDRIKIANGVTETIGALIIDNVYQPSGTYDESNAEWLTGGGGLIVARGPALDTTTITQGNGRHQTDDWNKPYNWDNGVPSGYMNAVVASGVRVVVDGLADLSPTPPTPVFTGTLTLQENAYLRLEESANAVLGAFQITMEEGSTIMSNFPGTIDYPPINLNGNAHFEYSSTGSHGETSNFETINGNHILTITGSNRMHLNFNAASTFSSLILEATDRYHVYAQSQSCLGSGDVIISGSIRHGRSAQLHLNANDTIGDDATLMLNGKGYDEATTDRITIASGVEETIGALIIDDVYQPGGAYNKTNADWLTGDGVLIVARGPALRTTTIVQGDGRHQTDDWNKKENWDIDVPSGSMNAVVAPGVRVVVDGLQDDAPITPIFTGTLTLQENAYLRLEQSSNAVLGAFEITMEEGSTIMSNFPGTINYPPINLNGNAHFEYSSTGSHGQTSGFGAINGNHILTITGSNRMQLNFNAASFFSSLILDASDRYHVYANSQSSLGSGDVTISGRDRDGRSAQLHLNVANTIGDHATLTLNGKGYNERTSDRIEIVSGVTEIIGALIIDDVQQPAGAYHKCNAEWLTGDGVLIVGVGQLR